MFYDRRGKEIRLETYAELIKFGNPYKIVEQTTIGKSRISTVWLGVNYQFFDGPPLIFETAIFVNDKFCEILARYSTEAEAVTGHKFWCQSIAEGWKVRSGN